MVLNVYKCDVVLSLNQVWIHHITEHLSFFSEEPEEDPAGADVDRLALLFESGCNDMALFLSRAKSSCEYVGCKLNFLIPFKNRQTRFKRVIQCDTNRISWKDPLRWVLFTLQTVALLLSSFPPRVPFPFKVAFMWISYLPTTHSLKVS